MNLLKRKRYSGDPAKLKKHAVIYSLSFADFNSGLIHYHHMLTPASSQSCAVPGELSSLHRFRVSRQPLTSRSTETSARQILLILGPFSVISGHSLCQKRNTRTNDGSQWLAPASFCVIWRSGTIIRAETGEFV